MQDRPILFLKAHVPEHQRRTKGGAMVTVREHDTSRPAAQADPHHPHLKRIAGAIARMDRASHAERYDAAIGMRMGRAPSRRTQERIHEETKDDMADAVHSMHDAGTQEGSPHHELVQHGHEAFGERGEFKGSTDPEGFADHFHRLFPQFKRKTPGK